jgi:hypothetical protein
MTHYRTLCRSAVAPAKLSHVIVATVITVGLLFVLSGIIKTIMAMSLIILVIIISHHDLLEKKPIKVVVSNFPNRARISLEQHMPLLQGKLSNRMAAGIMLVMVTLVIQSLFFPFSSTTVNMNWSSSSLSSSSTSKQQEPQQEHSQAAHPTIFVDQNESSSSFHAPMDTTTTTKESSVMTAPLDYDAILEFYELGFQDAKEGNEHGTSLPTRAEFILSWSYSALSSSSSSSITSFQEIISHARTSHCSNGTESSSEEENIECDIHDEGGLDDDSNNLGLEGEVQDTKPLLLLDSKTGGGDNNKQQHKHGGGKTKHKKSSKLSSRSKAVSITNAASLFYLYKSFQELGTCLCCFGTRLVSKCPSRFGPLACAKRVTRCFKWMPAKSPISSYFVLCFCFNYGSVFSSHSRTFSSLLLARLLFFLVGAVRSIISLLSTIHSLGTCPHTHLWGFAQLAANLHQAVPLWRKILLGLSVYNVVRIIL